MLIEHLPSFLIDEIKAMDSHKMRKIMDLMKIRIHFFKDMKNHTYFFTSPLYDSSVAEKFLNKLKQPDEVKISILTELAAVLIEIPKD